MHIHNNKIDIFYWGTDSSAVSGAVWNFISSLSAYSLQIFT